MYMDKFEALILIAIATVLLIIAAGFYFLGIQMGEQHAKYNCISSDGKTLKIKNVDGCKFNTNGTWEYKNITKDFITYTHSS